VSPSLPTYQRPVQSIAQSLQADLLLRLLHLFPILLLSSSLSLTSPPLPPSPSLCRSPPLFVRVPSTTTNKLLSKRPKCGTLRRTGLDSCPALPACLTIRLRLLSPSVVRRNPLRPQSHRRTHQLPFLTLLPPTTTTSTLLPFPPPILSYANSRLRRH
jgi:hypothetical protein